MTLLDRLRAFRRPKAPAAAGLVDGEDAIAPPGEGSAAVDLEYQMLLSELEAVRRSIADATATRKRLQAQLEQVRRLREDATERARIAARDGRDELARAALHEALEAEEKLADRQKTVDRLTARDRESRASAAELESRIHEYRVRLDVARAGEPGGS